MLVQVLLQLINEPPEAATLMYIFRQITLYVKQMSWDLLTTTTMLWRVGKALESSVHGTPSQILTLFCISGKAVGPSEG
jgi:hypothetical protein